MRWEIKLGNDAYSAMKSVLDYILHIRLCVDEVRSERSAREERVQIRNEWPRLIVNDMPMQAIELQE
jgi:hypothetical protein